MSSRCAFANIRFSCPQSRGPRVLRTAGPNAARPPPVPWPRESRSRRLFIQSGDELDLVDGFSTHAARNSLLKWMQRHTALGVSREPRQRRCAARHSGRPRNTTTGYLTVRRTPWTRHVYDCTKPDDMHNCNGVWSRLCMATGYLADNVVLCLSFARRARQFDDSQRVKCSNFFTYVSTGRVLPPMAPIALLLSSDRHDLLIAITVTVERAQHMSSCPRRKTINMFPTVVWLFGRVFMTRATRDRIRPNSFSTFKLR